MRAFGVAIWILLAASLALPVGVRAADPHTLEIASKTGSEFLLFDLK
jgi:hypothetical protein